MLIVHLFCHTSQKVITDDQRRRTRTIATVIVKIHSSITCRTKRSNKIAYTALTGTKRADSSIWDHIPRTLRGAYAIVHIVIG